MYLFVSLVYYFLCVYCISGRISHVPFCVSCVFVVSIGVYHTFLSVSLVCHFLYPCCIFGLVSHVPVCVSCVSFIVCLLYL